jgi:hypothetical protein
MSDPLIEAWNEASHFDDWNVKVVYRKTFLRLVADEVDRQARELYRRADNLPLTNECQIQRLGDFRAVADKLTDRARELREAVES